jgi:hypothetical protein
VIVLAGALLLASSPAATEAVPVRQFTHIHGLEVPAWAGGDVFVSTHFGLIRINSKGQWFQVGDTPHDFMGFTAHPSEQGVLYSSGHPARGSGLPNPIGFMVSRDGGASWEPTALSGEADFHAMAVQHGNGDVIYGFNVATNPGLYRSNDGGRSWQRIEAEALMRRGGAYALEIHPDDPEVLLAGTSGGLLYSADGGESWEVLALEDAAVTAVSYVAGNPRHILVYGAHPEFGLMQSQDGGASWEPTGFVLEGNDAIGYIAVNAQRSSEIYLGSYGQNLYRTIDGGTNWQPLAVNGVPQEVASR